jgi:hypothetical protein
MSSQPHYGIAHKLFSSFLIKVSDSNSIHTLNVILQVILNDQETLLSYSLQCTRYYLINRSRMLTPSLAPIGGLKNITSRFKTESH